MLKLFVAVHFIPRQKMSFDIAMATECWKTGMQVNIIVKCNLCWQNSSSSTSASFQIIHSYQSLD